MLYEIMPEGDAQLDLFSRFHDTDRGRRLMRTVDGLNRAMGRHTLRFAAEGIVEALADAARVSVGQVYHALGRDPGGARVACSGGAITSMSRYFFRVTGSVQSRVQLDQVMHDESPVLDFRVRDGELFGVQYDVVVEQYVQVDASGGPWESFSPCPSSISQCLRAARSSGGDRVVSMMMTWLRNRGCSR